MDEKDEDIVEVLASKGDKSLIKRTKGGEETYREISPVKEGQPIDPESELFSLEPRAGEHNRYNVRAVYDGKKGPTRAATKQYRQGWDNIFGEHKATKEMN